jgi:hypothetical protein
MLDARLNNWPQIKEKRGLLNSLEKNQRQSDTVLLPWVPWRLDTGVLVYQE